MTTQVLILGGGLAGLSLAIQLRREHPSLAITVLERRKHPVPHAIHKVGESTVEIGAHYFEHVLGLKEHLTTQQLKKFGFRFFFSDRRADIDATLELGASRFLATPAYQLDRGIFENFLARHAQSLGVEFLDGVTVRTIELNSQHQAHEVSYQIGDETLKRSARWLIDASGRAGLLKKKLGLQQDNAHDANAVWFRIGTKIDVDEWSTDVEWRDRCDPPRRWLSTNHFCGEGYWAWLIPLASGSHSVGIVCDARLHPLESMNSFEKAIAWMQVHQPRLARELESKRHLLQDFAFFRNFSYGCKQVFSADRWALTGEAGVFLDPFYSPGSDFIAIANTYIADLIARDLRGEALAGRTQIYQQLYFSFYESTLSLYQDQYAMFGDPEVFPTKIIWDYAFYWGILCQLFFQQRLTDVVSIGRLSAELTQCRALNFAMQRFLREWSLLSEKRNVAAMLDQAALPWFAELNGGLRDALDEDAFRERIKRHTELLNQLALQIIDRACSDYPELDASALRSVLGSVSGDPSPLLFGRAPEEKISRKGAKPQRMNA